MPLKIVLGEGRAGQFPEPEEAEEVGVRSSRPQGVQQSTSRQQLGAESQCAQLPQQRQHELAAVVLIQSLLSRPGIFQVLHQTVEGNN